MNLKSFKYERVAQKIEEGIKLQHLKPGDKLPSVRKISVQLKVSVNTVFQAMAILEAKSIIFSKPRSGYVVNFHEPSEIQLSEKYSILVPSSVEITQMATKMMKNAKQLGIVNFSILAPVNEFLPVGKLSQLASRALYGTMNSNFQYPLIDGLPILLFQIARRTFEWENSIHLESTLITNGAMEAINLCLDALTKPGDLVAVESPTYHGILQSIEQRGLKVLEIGIDSIHGLDPKVVGATLDQHPNIVACIFMPSCHNPTGASMPEEQKRKLAYELGVRNIPLIEDDSMGELQFTRYSYPVKAYDTFDNVLYCSSYSKTLAPGFRIGWVSAGKYHTIIEKLKFGSNISTNAVLQEAIGRYLETGRYDLHLHRMREGLKTQMLKYLEAIKIYFPSSCRIIYPQGGLSIWIRLPDGCDGFVLQQDALLNGIGICPGQIFSASCNFNQYIRINFGPLWCFRTEEAISKIGKLIASTEAKLERT